MAQRQIPGGPFVNEVGAEQRQIPGGPFIGEAAVWYAVPTADVTDGAWLRSDNNSNVNLFQMIDEVPYSDSDFIYSRADGSISRFKLDSLGVKALEYRIGGNGVTTVEVRLYEGVTLKHTWTHTNVGSVTHYLQEVTASISDTSNLYVEFETIEQ